MKNLNNYITEKLKIGKSMNVDNYTDYPKTRDELRKILEKRLKKDKNADLNDIDVSKITDMGLTNTNQGLFMDLDPHNIDISRWNVSNVKNMSGMFYSCWNFNCDLNDWDVGGAEDMESMFYDCFCFDSNLGNWNTSNVNRMISMFSGCTKFKGIGLDNWNTDRVVHMENIFRNCTSLKKLPDWYKQ